MTLSLITQTVGRFAMKTSGPGHVADLGVVVPGGMLAGWALWVDELSNVLGPLGAAILFFMILVLTAYRVLLAHTQWKIGREDLKAKRHDNEGFESGD